MDLMQLRYFLEVSKTLNYTKAAENLFISQPTLSQQIKKLEKELNVQLLARSTRKVELTPVGLLCVQQAQKAVEAADRIIEIGWEESSQQRQRLSIGMLAVYPQLNIYRIFAEFQSLHLMETVKLHSGWSLDLLDRLFEKKSDIIIINLDELSLPPEKRAMLDAHVFIRDQLYVIASRFHPLASKKTISISEVVHETLFMSGARSTANVFFAKAVHAAGYELPPTIDCPSLTSMFNFVETGQGIAVMSRHVSYAYIKPETVLIPLDPPVETSTAIVTLKANLQKPLVKEFRDYFLSHQALGEAQTP